MLPKQPISGGLSKFRGRVYEGKVDVLNGISGIEHLSNSIVRKPLHQYGVVGYQPTVASKEYGFRRNESVPDVGSRERSRGSIATSSANPEVAYDPFWSNQQRYLAH